MQGGSNEPPGNPRSTSSFCQVATRLVDQLVSSGHLPPDSQVSPLVLPDADVVVNLPPPVDESYPSLYPVCAPDQDSYIHISSWSWELHCRKRYLHDPFHPSSLTNLSFADLVSARPYFPLRWAYEDIFWPCADTLQSVHTGDEWLCVRYILLPPDYFQRYFPRDELTQLGRFSLPLS